MTKEQRDKLRELLGVERNRYAEDRKRVIEKEYGKIEGADFMLSQMLNYLRAEAEKEEE